MIPQTVLDYNLIVWIRLAHRLYSDFQYFLPELTNSISVKSVTFCNSVDSDSDEVSKITPNKQFNATFDLPCIVIKSFQLFSTRTIPAEQNLLKKIQSSTPRDVDEV